MNRLLAITMCLGVTLAATGTAPAGIGGSSDAKTLVLQSTDYPPGFTRSYGDYYSNAQAAHDNGELLIFYALKGMGRVNGYRTEYGKHRPGPRVYAITSSASVYLSASGAHASFRHSGVGTPVPVEFTIQAGDPTEARRLPGPRIGQEVMMFFYPGGSIVPGAGRVASEYFLAWRSGRFLGAITTYYGARGPSAAAQATTVALAQKQEARMLRAG